jgi:exosortase
MNKATENTISGIDQDSRSDLIKIMLPYGLALLAQLPLLVLYFRRLWNLPHYQPFAIAILATAGIAIYRWPYGQPQPFFRSLASDILLLLGMVVAFLGMLFVEPWFAALSAMLIVTSFLARTFDRETGKSLWTCSLPLFVYLTLPLYLDVKLITSLQRYSAIYTSRLLDLFGLGHHMDGTVIKVAVENVNGIREYGIEEACSGVQSFFTLLLVAVVFVVLSRRIKLTGWAVGVLAVCIAFLCFVLRATALSMPVWSESLLISGVGFILLPVLGFRATLLVLSAIFWALFVNIIRIILIPVVDILLGYDLSHGISHDILGYSALTLGILMIFSTDQFLLFLFGPVETENNESGSIGESIARFWNRIISADGSLGESNDVHKTASGRVPISKSGFSFIWIVAFLIIAMGAFQFADVRRSIAQTDLKVRFFDADVTLDYEEDDIPKEVDGWKQVKYEVQDRSQGSDLGQRSDVWQFRSPTCAAVASLDQAFPGWHELTTCYKNQGWDLKTRVRKKPSEILGSETEADSWPFIEATFEKKTGEKGYLLFSHFDAFGEGVDAPEQWNSINSFFVRAQNRMSHRIRSSLLRGEVYQTQVFLTSFSDLDESVKQEVNERYLKIREQLRIRFKEKKKQLENATEAP